MAGKRVLQGLLTDMQIRGWVRARKPIAKSDGGGLTFTLSASGTGAWVLRYRVAGRRRELTLGNYPDIALADARRMAREKRVLIDQGQDPATLKVREKQEARQAVQIRDLIEEYKTKKLSSLSANTQRTYARQLKIIKSGWGLQAVNEVTPEDFIDLLDRRKGRWGAGSKGWRETETLYIVARQLFKFAAGKRLIKVNPTVGISLETVIGARPKPRVRLMLTHDELTEVMNARMNRQNQLSVWILLATAVRVSELYTTRKENLLLDEHTIKRLGSGCWRVPASKTGPAIDIPLAPPVVAWFRELVALSLDSQYVLPARSSDRLDAHGGDAHVDENTIACAIDYWIEAHNPKIRRFTPHDLRSTAKSYLRALKVPREISEMCLNHKLPGVEGIYDQYTYWPERREALEALVTFFLGFQRMDAKNAGLARKVARRRA